MKHPLSRVLLALFILTLAGCSKHSAPTPTASSDLKNGDWGIVEVSDGMPIEQSLGGNKTCIITPTVFTNGMVSLIFDIEETNSAGVVRTLGKPRTKSMAGQAVEVWVNDIYIRLTPKIKQLRATQN
jgi:hypothetical protein